MAKARKLAITKGTVAEAVSAGWGEISSLAEEVREIVDNAPEGLNQTQRIQTLDETANYLENIDEPEVPEALSGVRVEWTQLLPRTARRGLSRADRCSNAVAALEVAATAAQTWMDDHEEEEGGEDHDAVLEFLDSVQGAIDDAEAAEFPGMFG